MTKIIFNWSNILEYHHWFFNVFGYSYYAFFHQNFQIFFIDDEHNIFIKKKKICLSSIITFFGKRINLAESGTIMNFFSFKLSLQMLASHSIKVLIEAAVLFSYTSEVTFFSSWRFNWINATFQLYWCIRFCINSNTSSFCISLYACRNNLTIPIFLFK